MARMTPATKAVSRFRDALRTPTKYLDRYLEVTKTLMEDLGLFNFQDIIDFTRMRPRILGRHH